MSKQKQIVVRVPALGRPFQLGMLYDWRTDSLVTGLTLWDKDVIDNATQSSPKRSCKVTVSTKDDLNSKMFHVGASASITLSILSGSIEVKGSAEFLYDTIDSSETSRVTLHYSSTSRFEQLMISKADKDKVRKHVVDQKLATHVVAGILYGADAVFTFDHKKDEKGSNVGVSGKLEAAVKNIPSTEISGSISGSLSQEEKKIADNLSCNFHGDLILDPLPTTYNEALNAYRSVTEMIGAGAEDETLDKSVPMKVWLLPLSAVQSNAPGFVKQLTDELSARAKYVMEDFENIKKEASNLKKRIGTEYRFMDFIQNRLDDVIATIEVHRINLATELSELLPKLKGTVSTGEVELMELLEKMTAKPFDADSLRDMLEDTEREANTLNHLFSLINDKVDNGKIDLAIDPGDFNKALLTAQQADLVTLEIIATTSSPYLDWMKGTTTSIDETHVEWYDKPSVVIKLRDRVQTFIDFAEINASDTVKCIATCHKMKSMESDDRVKIKLFSDGHEPKDDFQIPRRPRNFSISYQPNSTTVKLEWQKPSVAKNILAYVVEIRKDSEEPSTERLTDIFTGKKEGKIVNETTTYTCVGLTRDATYTFTVQAECGIAESDSESEYTIGLCEKSNKVTQRIEKEINTGGVGHPPEVWYLSPGIVPCECK